MFGSLHFPETVSLVSTSPSIPSLPAELPAHIKELTQDGVPYIDYEHIKIEAELGSVSTGVGGGRGGGGTGRGEVGMRVPWCIHVQCVFLCRATSVLCIEECGTI